MFLGKTAPHGGGELFFYNLVVLFQQSLTSLHPLGGSKSIVSPLFFNTFENWTIFVGVVRRINGRQLKNNNFKQKRLGTAVPSCFFKVHHANFSLFSSFLLPVSHFFIFSTPLRRLKRGQEGGPGALPDPTTLCTPKSAKTIEKLMVFCYF